MRMIRIGLWSIGSPFTIALKLFKDRLIHKELNSSSTTISGERKGPGPVKEAEHKKETFRHEIASRTRTSVPVGLGNVLREAGAQRKFGMTFT